MKRIVELIIILMLCYQATGHAETFEFDEIEESVQIHGFISQGFLQSEGNNFYADTKEGTFQFNEVGLNVSADLTDRLHTSIQLLSRDIGDIGNNKIQVDLAYADYHWKDWLGFRIGKVKVNYGLYNETRDIDLFRTNILLPQSVYPESLRDIYHSLYGIELYGYRMLGFLGSLSYQFQSGQKNMTGNTGIAKFFHEDAENATVELSYVELRDITTFSLDWETFITGFHLKTWVGAYQLDALFETQQELEREGELLPPGTEFHSDIDRKYRVILSAEYVGRSLVLAAEMHGDIDNVEASLSFYLGGSLRLTDWCEIGTYYSESFSGEVTQIDGELIAFEDTEESAPDYTELVLTTRFDLNDQWTLKFEGHFVEGTGSFWKQDNPDGFQDESSLLAIKTTFNF